MKTLLILLFSVQSLLAGDSVNNGGGLSEQALIYSAQHMPQFIQSCMQYSYCGANEPDRSKLLELLSCNRPKDTEIRFGNPTDEPFQDGTKLGLPYRHLNNGEFFVNRAYLYPNDQPMLLPQTIGHLARLQLNDCNVIPFSGSAEIAKNISWMAEQEGEQITIGKEEIFLPAYKIA